MAKMGKPEIVKAVVINGKTYRTPINAAKAWVSCTLFRLHYDRWYVDRLEGFASGSEEHERYCKAYNRVWDKARNKRYVDIVLPIFERML